MSKEATKRLFRPKRGPNATVLNWHSSPELELSYYARSFQRAARTLVESWELDQNSSTDWDACPVVFLYRHAVELYLKGLLLGRGASLLNRRPTLAEVMKDHSLKRLMPFIREMFAAVGWDGEFDREGIRTFDELEKLIWELDDADRGSHTFRYPITKKGDGSVRSAFTFSVLEFAGQMEHVCELLDGATCGLPEEWQRRAEAAALEADLYSD